MLFTYLPTCCVLCGLQTYETHNFCIPCFNSSKVYAQEQLDAYPRTYSLFPYRDPFARIIVKLKFNHQLIYAKALGECLAYQAQTRWYKGQMLPDRLIPVPLHPERLQERGFNQALEISRHTAKKLGLALDGSSISRIKPTSAQSGLSKTLRHKNMQNAFASRTRLDGLHVAIVDDVITTGQTVAELARVLHHQGAARIDVWCCARA